MTFFLLVRFCCKSSRSFAVSMLVDSKQHVRLLVLSLAIAVSLLALSVCLAFTAFVPTTQAEDCRGLAVADKALMSLAASLSSYLLAKSAILSDSVNQPNSCPERHSIAVFHRQWRLWGKTADLSSEHAPFKSDLVQASGMTAHTAFTHALYASLILECVGWITWISTTREDFSLVMLDEGGSICLVYLHSKLFAFALSCSLRKSETRKQLRTLLTMTNL